MNTEQQLGELLSLLERSYSLKDTKAILDITQSINKLENNCDNYLELLFKGLSLISFNNKQISLDLHKSLAINLKNAINKNILELNNGQIFILLHQTLQLFFSNVINTNLFDKSIINIFENIITLLSSRDSIKSNCEELFNILLLAISGESAISDNFINKSKAVIIFCKGLFEAKILSKNNYIKIINEYYIVIIDIIFKRIEIYIDPNKQIYNENYISLLSEVIDDIYINSKNILKNDFIENTNFNAIISNIFIKYGSLFYELIKMQIPLDEESKKIFINQNPILIFNKSEKYCSCINKMKSKCFQLFCFITEQLSLKINNKTQNPFFLIKNEKLVQINAELIKLIISCLQDILINKEKYDLIKNPREGMLGSGTSYNSLLFNMLLLMLRCFTREPIKKEFSEHIKYFALNILFPLMASTKEEQIFLEEEPYEYQIYINDIIHDFKLRNFKTALCYLLKKICNTYSDMNNFILSYAIEMICFIFNSDNGTTSISNSSTYNIYLDSENKSLINSFNDEIKIDFCFLILLLLKDNLLSHNYLKNKFITFFVENQDKIHQINSVLILVKICKIYSEYSIYIIKHLQTGTPANIKNAFIEKMINMILLCIINYKNGTDFNEIFISEASNAILTIIKFSKNYDIKHLHIKEIINEKIQIYFKKLIKLIDNLDNISLNIVISEIIESIPIKERQDVINCLEHFTKKFQIIVNTNYAVLNKEDKSRKKTTLFINQYFLIINNYLKGVNKFDILNKSEIIQFNNIISPVISYISDIQKSEFHEEIVSLGHYYIIALNSINEISIQILDNLYQVIKRDLLLNGEYYTFISTFLFHINKEDNYKQNLDKIINIIKLCFSFPKENFFENILSILLLIFQIISSGIQIDYDSLKCLIIEIYKYYFISNKCPNNKENQEIAILNERSYLEKAQQVLIADISLCFINYPENTYKILIENISQIYNSENNSYNITNLRELIINLYSSMFDLEYPYYSLLGRCDVLSLCSIIRNKNILSILYNDSNQMLLLLKLLINIVVKHKEESVKIQAKLTNSEIKCGFINSDNEQSEDEDLEDFDNGFDSSFYEKIKNCLKDNSIVMNNDEFQIFSDTIYQIKNNDKILFDNLFKNFNKRDSKTIRDLLFVRNIKVEYNGEKYDIPRRTLKIKRNIH